VTTLASVAAWTAPVRADDSLQVGIHGETQMIYRYGNVHGALGSGGIGIEPGGALQYDAGTNSDIYLPTVRLSLVTMYSKLLFARISTALLTTDFYDEPLTSPTALADYRQFLRNQRATGQANMFSRTLVLQDAYLSIADATVGGAVIVGQQPVPLGYWTQITAEAPVTVMPQATAMTDYINLNVLPFSATPYQNSTLTRVRDIGIQVAGKINLFSYQLGFFSGAGPNRNDDNNSRDFLWRVDANTSEGSQLGFSQLRGKDVAWRLIGADRPFGIEYDRLYNDIHARLLLGQNTILGEYVFTQQYFGTEGVTSNQSGWYLTSLSPTAANTWLVLQYATFFDQDVRRDGSNLPYSIRRATVGLRYDILPSQVQAQLEYNRTWEDLNGTLPGEKANAIYGSWNIILTAQL